MRKIIMKLRSQLGTVLEVVKQDDEYQLVTSSGLVSIRSKEADEDGVTKIKIYTDSLIELGWSIV